MIAASVLLVDEWPPMHAHRFEGNLVPVLSYKTSHLKDLTKVH